MTLLVYNSRKQQPADLFAKTGVFFLLMFAACSNPGNNPKEDMVRTNTTQEPLPYRKPSAAYDDTLIIQGKAAVFFSPDTAQLRKIKEITEPRVYANDTHDCIFQMRNARLVLKQYWPHLHLVETSGVRWLLFLKADKSKVFIDLDSKGAMCGILLFDPRKDPQLVDMTNIETALRFYFEK